MALQNIARQNISDEVYQQFIDAIMNGEWKPEEKIPSETELASQMGVSRVTIRGVKFPLEDAEISNGFPLGVSNEWTDGEALVTAHEGTLLIVESRM